MTILYLQWLKMSESDDGIFDPEDKIFLEINEL